MAKKATANCLVCGKEFEKCNTCNKNIDEMLQWRRVTCCPEHFQYHLPIIQYVRKQISKAEAKAELDKAIKDYGDIDFADNIKAVIAEIMVEDKKPKSKKKATIVDESVVESFIGADSEYVESGSLEVPFLGK